MATVDLKRLVERLDGHSRRSLEAAAGLTLSRSHYNIELEHFLLKLIEASDSTIAISLTQHNVDHGRLGADLIRCLDRLTTGNARAPGLSPDIVELIRQAWLFASVDQGSTQITSAHLLWALLADENLARRAREMSEQFARIAPEALKRSYPKSVNKSDGDGGSANPSPATASAQSLERYTVDLTERAKLGQIDPILGRDAEVRQVIDILTRRRQNNPILVGEAGVGKTAVAEGFALRIVANDVPPALADVAVRKLDLALLQAGTGVSGEFERRLKSVIEEVKASPQPIILFIDEAHTLIGAGGPAGQNDAANLLKPALARGELRTIAATTWAEYKLHIEKDAALTRRFQMVKVDEPTEAVAISMVRGLVAKLEEHHGVRILDEAVRDCVRLSARYIPSRQLPDKAVSLIDTACARVSMSHSSTPAPIEDRRRRRMLIETELAILAREDRWEARHEDRRTELSEEYEMIAQEMAKLETRWAHEKDQIEKLKTIRERIDSGAENPTTLQKELATESENLRSVQGEQPLVFPVVDGQAVAEIVQSWTGIPAGRMRGDEIQTVLNLLQTMEQRIIGQPYALDSVVRSIRTARAKLTDPRKPIAVFLMVGTSGVGKTETALALADLLYGGEQNLTVINMNEFKEEHKVSLLMGSPPGYIGYGEGGILTEAVRRHPYSVVLLDEVEKAHPGVQDIFYQVFDKGSMTDGAGREIDFRNTVVIMTSNVGTDLISKLCADPETTPDPAALTDALRPELLKYFKPAFLGRTTVIPYYPLSASMIQQIVSIQMNRIGDRVRETYGAAFHYDSAVVQAIARRCTESASGAREVENILSRTLLPELSNEMLKRMANGASVAEVTVVTDGAGGFAYNLC